MPVFQFTTSDSKFTIGVCELCLYGGTFASTFKNKTMSVKVHTMTIQQNIDIELTPEQLAQLFTEMDAIQQSRFFNHIGKETTTWKQPLEFQLAAIESCERLNDDGKRVLNTMSQMFATHDIVALFDACQTVVNSYKTDGFEGMRERDIIFNEMCKRAIAKRPL